MNDWLKWKCNISIALEKKGVQTHQMSKFHVYTWILQGTLLFSGKIYTLGNIFTRPPVATVATNFKSAKADCLMNSKSEFHQHPVVRVVPMRGIQLEQGEEQRGGRGRGQRRQGQWKHTFVILLLTLRSGIIFWGTLSLFWLGPVDVSVFLVSIGLTKDRERSETVACARFYNYK